MQDVIFSCLAGTLGLFMALIWYNHFARLRHVSITKRNTHYNTGRRAYLPKSLLRRRRRLVDWSDTEQSPEEIERILAMQLKSKPVSGVKGCLKQPSPARFRSQSADRASKWTPFRRKGATTSEKASASDKENRESTPSRSVSIKEPSKKSLEDLRALYGDDGIGGFRPTREIYIVAKRIKAGLPPFPVTSESTKTSVATVPSKDSESDGEEFLSIKARPRLLSPPPAPPAISINGKTSRSKSPPLVRSSSASPARAVRAASPASVTNRYRKNRSPDTRSRGSKQPRLVDLSSASLHDRRADVEADDEYEDVSSGASTPERVNPPVLPFTALDSSFAFEQSRNKDTTLVMDQQHHLQAVGTLSSKVS